MTSSALKQPNLRRWSLRLGACAALVILGSIALLYFRQHDMIYHPRPYTEDVAGALAPDGIELRYTTIASAQTAFYLPRGLGKNLPERIWVAFGGNGSLALEWISLIARDQKPGDAFVLVEYPGYGKSAGHASILTNRAAAEGALEALRTHLGVESGQIESRLNVIGHSFGTATGLDFATRHTVQRVVLVAPFTTLREEGGLVVGQLLSHLLIENYDNRARLRELVQRQTAPRIAIFHGTADDIIPVRMGRELAAEHPALIQFFPLEGGDHLSPLLKNADKILGWMNH